ncbi:MAG: serine hydrolase domain-containing protein, partial [Myxococcota bacterium]
GIDPAALDSLYRRVEKAVGRHEGCGAQVAVARGGRVAGFRAFGSARFAGETRPVDRDSLFAVFSVTKAFVSSAAWMLLSDGVLALGDRVVDTIPEFGRNGKQAVTVEHLLTHTAGFPSATMDAREWLSEEHRLERFGDWKLEWKPGSRFTYHGTATMWILGQLITQLTRTDYRDFIRTRIFEPLGLTDLFIGLPEEQHSRVAEIIALGEPMSRDERAVSPVDAPTLSDEMVSYANGSDARTIGSPGGGGIGTAADVALFYQGVLACLDPAGGGLWDSAGVVDACTPRNVEFIDPMTKQPALRGLGLVVAGDEGRIWRGFAPNHSARAFGHMGAGGQVAWGDPVSGISFAFLTNGAERNPARQGANGLRLSNIAAGSLLPSEASARGGGG